MVRLSAKCRALHPLELCHSLHIPCSRTYVPGSMPVPCAKTYTGLTGGQSICSRNSSSWRKALWICTLKTPASLSDNCSGKPWQTATWQIRQLQISVFGSDTDELIWIWQCLWFHSRTMRRILTFRALKNWFQSLANQGKASVSVWLWFLPAWSEVSRSPKLEPSRLCSENFAEEMEIIKICALKHSDGYGDLWDCPTFQAIEALRHNLCALGEISISQKSLFSLWWLMDAAGKWNHGDVYYIITCFDMYSASYLWW